MSVSSKQPETAIPSGVALIGLAGRFPGADSSPQFWENLVAGVSGVADVRLETRRSSLPGHPNYVAKSAVVKNGDHFDAKFFGIYPKQAIDLDPQHRVFLEMLWHAMEDAGDVPDNALGRVDVFAGCHVNTYVFTRWVKHEVDYGLVEVDLRTADDSSVTQYSEYEAVEA